MFSIEKPLEPLSSSSSPNSQSQLVISEQETRSDERNSDSDKVFDSQKQHDNAIDLLVDSPPTPIFSIRDYAYKSRSKSIETNWPFKPKFLTLCLKNGIKQLLPPFEPPDLIKTRPVITFQPDPLSSSHVLIPNSTSDESTLSDTENLPLVAIKDKKKKNKALEKVKKVKKCNILVTGSNQTREKEIGSNNNSVTDPMASKICPVCKTFSSSSNTTLNAHIDQCLSMDSDSKQIENDVSKPKIKPKKKKLLTEIYETALCYTLEDLDRRNGTNWALNGVTGPNVEKGKPVKDSSDEERESCRGDEREGAVYVDSNGIKIRILSKFDDLKEEGAMVLKEEKKKEKGKFGNKKFKGVEMKNTKKKNNLESKKLKPFKGLKTRVQPPREGKINETQNKNSNEITNEVEFEFNVQNETEKSKIQNNIIIPLSNWVCAKRSDTPKKRNKKNPYKITHNLLDNNNSLSPSTSQQIPKFSNSKSSNPSLNTPLRFKFPKPNRDISTESVNLQNSPSKSFKKQRSVLKHSKKSSVSTRVLHEEENHFEDITSRANKRLKFTQCNLADPNEITQNYRDQNENSQLDIIESSLPTINENFENINEPHKNEDPLMSPQIDNSINDDVMDDDVDDDVIEGEENYNTSLDTPQEDSSITSNWDEELNLDSESPISTFSTMSLSSKEPGTTPSDSLTNDPLTPMDSEITERVKKVEEIADKPFACSCRENLSKEKQLLPPLYIGPRETVPYQRPENLIGTGFDLPSPSFSTLSQGPVPVSVPIPASPSNPILRLMGKNLLVVNQEEITITPSTPSSSVSRTGFMPPQNLAYQSQSMMMNNPYRPFHRNEMNRQVSVSPYMQKEVIVIDDSPEMNPVPVPVSVPMPQNISILGSPMMQQSPFLYYPTQNHQVGLGPTGTMGTIGTTGTVMYPRVGTGYFTPMGPSGVHETGPFIFRPPSGYLDPSLYYSHTMR